MTGENLEIVNKYKYLGFEFSTQLSFSNHLKMLNIKARARIGVLFQKLPIHIHSFFTGSENSINEFCSILPEIRVNL